MISRQSGADKLEECHLRSLLGSPSVKPHMHTRFCSMDEAERLSDLTRVCVPWRLPLRSSCFYVHHVKRDTRFLQSLFSRKVPMLLSNDFLKFYIIIIIILNIEKKSDYRRYFIFKKFSKNIKRSSIERRK